MNNLNKTNRRELFLKMADKVYTDVLINRIIDIEVGLSMLKGILEMRADEIMEEQERFRIANAKKYPYKGRKMVAFGRKRNYGWASQVRLLNSSERVLSATIYSYPSENTKTMNKTKDKKLRCECPTKGYVPSERKFMYSNEEKSGMNHEPNKCEGINNIKKYRRGDKKLYLCSCCFLFTDVEINN